MLASRQQNQLASQSRRRRTPGVVVTSRHCTHGANYCKKGMGSTQNSTQMSRSMTPHTYHEGMKKFYYLCNEGFQSRTWRATQAGLKWLEQQEKEIGLKCLWRKSLVLVENACPQIQACGFDLLASVKIGNPGMSHQLFQTNDEWSKT